MGIAPEPVYLPNSGCEPIALATTYQALPLKPASTNSSFRMTRNRFNAVTVEPESVSAPPLPLHRLTELLLFVPGFHSEEPVYFASWTRSGLATTYQPLPLLFDNQQ